MHFFGPYAYRSAFHSASEDEETARALEHLEQTIILEGASTIGAIILETVVVTKACSCRRRVISPASARSATSTASSTSPTRSWSASARIGEWFAVDAFDVVPDLITFAKGVNSG